MPIDTHPRHKRAPEEITAQQKEQAAKDKARAIINARREAATNVPAKSGNASTAVAMPDNRTPAQRYADEIAPASISGRLIRFSKEGAFTTADDGEAVPETVDFLALVDEIAIGWIKFSGDDAVPPTRVMGLLYSDFVMPSRAVLGDADEAQWGPGVDGNLEDPWKHQVLVPLQNAETKEFFTFGTTSITGRRSCGNLIKHFDRMQKTNPGEVPVVRLKAAGYNHEKFGWVATPQFAIVGHVSRDDAAKPDTSAAGDMNDQIPF